MFPVFATPTIHRIPRGAGCGPDGRPFGRVASAAMLLWAAVVGCNPITTGAKYGVRLVGDVVDDADVKQRGKALVGRPVSAADETFGKPIADHQAIAFQLAEMATKVEAAHLMMVNAARLKDSGERNDVAAGMAKYLASEFCSEVTQQSFRIHGGYGYSKEYEIERLMRDAPFLLIGEGTSEIQKQIISKRLLADYRI